MHSMEKPCDEQEQWEQLALQAEEYNDHACLLTSLTNETLIDIFSHCLANDIDQVQSLEKSIKNFMKISMACKNFNSLLTFEIIGHFCKNYTQDNKDNTLHKLTNNLRMDIIKTIRLPTLILICSDVNANIINDYDNSLLQSAVWQNDAQLVATLFKHHATPDAKWCGEPIFFQAATIELAQMFIDKGADVQAKDDESKTNVLWTVVNNAYPSNFMALYLAHHVDAKKLSIYNDSCLLHALAAKPNYIYYKINNIDDFLRKGKLLLDAIPDMVNTLNRKGRTPIDVAQKSFERSERIGSQDAQVFKQLIALFREYGGKTAQELMQQAS